MKFFIADYNHSADRMERVSPKFDLLSEAYRWNDLNGKRNSDDELTGIALNDHNGDMMAAEHADSWVKDENFYKENTMVKSSLVKGSTTRTIGKLILKWIMKAGCGVMVRINGVETAVCVFGSLQFPALCDSDGVSVPMASCRIHRDTIRQIRNMIGV